MHIGKGQPDALVQFSLTPLNLIRMADSQKPILPSLSRTGPGTEGVFPQIKRKVLGSESFEVGGERSSLEFLELSNSAAARKVELRLWNDAMEKEYPRRNYL